jgi:Zn-dependent peptidase ImmA (M78 family)
LRLTDKRYEELKQEVSNLLETYCVEYYPLSMLELALCMKIPVKSYSVLGPETKLLGKLQSADAFTIWIENEPQILFNEQNSKNRCRFSLAHELAHIWLEHTEDNEVNESEANFFAGYLLAPVPLINHYGIDDPYEVSNIFRISFEASLNALSRAEKRRHSRKNNEIYEYEIVNMCKLERCD